MLAVWRIISKGTLMKIADRLLQSFQREIMVAEPQMVEMWGERREKLMLSPSFLAWET
jgi:hypothetical protein